MAPRKRRQPTTDLTAQAQQGIRRGARRIGSGVLGAAGVSTLALLAVSSVLPLLAGPVTLATATAWLAGLGSNALAGWLASWAEKAGSQAIWEAPDDQQALLAQMAADLDRQMALDHALSDAVAALLEQTAAIPTALDTLTTQVDAQTDQLQAQQQQLAAQVALLQALRADARRSDLIQGRLHQLVQAQLAAQTEAILAASSQVSAEMQELLAVVRELRDEVRAAKAPITITASATAGTVQQGMVNVTGVAIRELRGEQVQFSAERIAVTQYLPPPPPDPAAQARAMELLATLPLDTIPDVAPLPPGSRMPFTRNPLFVGRAADLRWLAAALREGGTAAIGQVAAATGLGGIGKTNLATEFAHRYGQYFAGGVFWLSFADGASVPAEIAACAAALGLPGLDALTLDDVVALVRRAWQEPLPRLLIFDNCEDQELIARWRPTSGGCRVLLTSRRTHWGSALGVAALPLEVLPRSESIALLRMHLGPKNKEQRIKNKKPGTENQEPGSKNQSRFFRVEDSDPLDALAAELGDLPLALHLAGSFLETYRDDPDLGNPAAFLAELRDARLLQHPALQGEDVTGSPTGHALHVGRTFALSYDRLQPGDPADALLLARAAHFAPGEPIPRDLLLKTVELPDKAVQKRASRALNRLRDLGLLEVKADGALVLHRLLATFVREVAQDAAAQAVVEETMFSTANELNGKGYPGPLIVLQAHLRYITEMAMGREDERAARLCSALDYHLDMIGDYAGARPYSERALAIREQALGRDHPDVAFSLNNLAELLRTQGDYAAARPLFERALAILEQSLGGDHPNVALSLNNLALLLYVQGENAAARPLLERALAIHERALGRDHPTTRIIRANLAALGPTP